MAPFVQARYFHRGRTAPIRLVVIHDMEAPERSTTAEGVADYFRSGKVKASAHWSIDCDSEVCCVLEGDTAFHAPGANHDGVGLEHAGYARQSAEEWLDEYGQAMLRRSAKIAADICRRHKLPAVWLSAADVKAGLRGITSHHNVSLAYGKSSHTDPGPSFPIEFYLTLVRVELGLVAPPAPPQSPEEDDDMAMTPEQRTALVKDIAAEVVRKLSSGSGPKQLDGSNWTLDEIGDLLFDIKDLLDG